MKKYLFFLLLMVCGYSQTFAQMTDDQVVETVKNQLSQGKDQRTIAIELMRNGVSQTQLLRIRDKYMSTKVQESKTQEQSSIDEERGRKSNGEKADTTAFLQLE